MIYEACPQNVSNFFHVENTFTGNECYIDGKAGLSAVFQRITVVIDALVHSLWYFSYTLVKNLSCHIATHTLRPGADQSSKAAFDKSAFAKTCSNVLYFVKDTTGTHQSSKKQT